MVEAKQAFVFDHWDQVLTWLASISDDLALKIKETILKLKCIECFPVPGTVLSI